MEIEVGGLSMRMSRVLKVLKASAFAIWFGALSLSPSFAEEDSVELPGWLQELVADLPQDKQDFLTSDSALSFAARPELLYRRLEGKTKEQVEAYIDGMMTVVEAAKFNPDKDLPAIPLNTDTEYFNDWKVMRPKAMNPAREPGPFHLSYYMTTRRTGIRTFADAPVAIYPEDLIAGKVDVAIVGAPLDMGSGMRGAKHAPDYMRMTYGMAGIDMYTMVDPSEELNIVDYGNIAVDNWSTERTMGHVRERVAEISKTGALPFIVGGDHSLEYANIAALADVHGKGSFGVVHFDAHFDAGKGSAHFITHGQPVYRAVKEGHVKGENYVQVGLRGPWPSADGFEWMRDNGVRYHTMPEIVERGWDTVMEDALNEARGGGKKLYISFDVDALDPAYMPGTGTPVPGGMTMREAIPIVRRLCGENDLVGFEIVEIAPLLDSSYRTVLNGNFLVHACLTGVAMRKAGIEQKGYVAELTQDHKQPRKGKSKPDPEKVEKVDPEYALGVYRKSPKPADDEADD